MSVYVRAVGIGPYLADFIPAASAVVTSAKTDNTIIVNLRNMYFIDISFSYSGKIIE